MNTSVQCRPAMLYDGSCPLCAKEVSHYRRLDKTGAVRWLDINGDLTLLEQHNIDFDTAMRYLHVITADGNIARGAYGFATIWSELPYYRHLAKVVSLPGVLPVLDRLYSRFASWRYARRSQCSGASRAAGQPCPLSGQPSKDQHN